MKSQHLQFSSRITQAFRANSYIVKCAACYAKLDPCLAPVDAPILSSQTWRGPGSGTQSSIPQELLSVALTHATRKKKRPRESFEFSPGASSGRLERWTLQRKKAEQCGGVRACPAITKWAVTVFSLLV